MDLFLSILAFLCCLAGIVGCVVPVLPGPVLSFAGLFCAYACSYSTLTPASMWLWAGLTAAVTAVDYFLPGYMAKLFGGTRAGMIGATVGLIAGLFAGGPVGIVLGPFAGAVAGGYGNMYGAIIGGMFFGILETFTTAYVTTTYKDCLSFAVLILLLIVMPTGLFKEQVLE